MADVPHLFEFYCPDETWKSTSRKIGRRGGRYFRSSVTGAVYSTVEPPDVGPVHQVDKYTAIERLSEAVRQTPLNWSARHPVTHSHGWGFPAEEGGKRLYRNIGQGPSGPTANERVRQVLDGHHLPPAEQLRKSIWSKLLHGLCWTYPSWWGERRRRCLIRDLGAGELLGDWADEWSADEELQEGGNDRQFCWLELEPAAAGAT